MEGGSGGVGAVMWKVVWMVLSGMREARGEEECRIVFVGSSCSLSKVVLVVRSFASV